MAIIRIQGRQVDVDIIAELSAYDWGDRARWSSDKLIASSPFRSDSHPSFYVILDGEYAGVWGDSGAVGDYEKGGFVKLLTILRGETYEESAKYLIEKYGVLFDDTSEHITLPTVSIDQKDVQPVVLPAETIVKDVSPYLSRRGIGEQAQRLYGVGRNDNHIGYTALGWYHENGELGNVKYRSTKGKRFFYASNGEPVRRLVYGLDVVNRMQADTAVICEAEIDAMSFATVGATGIATGSAGISKTQVEAIKRSGVRTIVLGGDNDVQGRAFNRKVYEALRWHKEIEYVIYGDCKDANEVLTKKGAEELRRIYENRRKINVLKINLK